MPGLHRSYLPIADAGYRISHENTAELKKLTLATLAFQTEEEEDEDAPWEKKKLRVYIYRIEEIDHGNFSFSNRRGGGWRYEDEPWEKKLRVSTYLFFIKYEGGSNFKRVIHLYIILSNLDFNQDIILSKTYFHIS